MNKSQLILHNYPISPYSEKIRSMLGYTGLNWYSVRTTEAPPRPQLEPLTGGYRKIPVAQLGADVFCDTRVIAEQVAKLSGHQELSLAAQSAQALTLMRYAEDKLFFACGLSAASLTLMLKTFRMIAFPDFVNFMKDRTAMNKDAAAPFPGMKESKRMVLAHLESIEAQLQDTFLFGNTPCLADFGVFHGLWMIHRLGEKRFIRNFPKTVTWIERMESFGKRNPDTLDAEAALDIAKACEPGAVLPESQQHEWIGSKVTIGPDDYAMDTTSGILVGSTSNCWVLQRAHQRVGTVHVHFPVEGYCIKRKT